MCFWYYSEQWFTFYCWEKNNLKKVTKWSRFHILKMQYHHMWHHRGRLIRTAKCSSKEPNDRSARRQKDKIFHQKKCFKAAQDKCGMLWTRMKSCLSIVNWEKEKGYKVPKVSRISLIPWVTLQSGIMKSLATVKGFRTCMDQKLIKNQTASESTVFLSAFTNI